MDIVQPSWVKANRSKLLETYKENIRLHNASMLMRMLLLCCGLFVLMLMIVPFSSTTKWQLAVAYLLCFLSCCVLVILSRTERGKQHPRVLLYAGFSVLFLLSLYLSAVYSPDQRATIILGLYCAIPLSIIDDPLRTDLFLFGFFVAHTILGFSLKPHDIAFDDLANGICFLATGVVLGRSVVLTRLGAYEAEHRLSVEKDTDVLTGLFNRRKLFETLNSFSDVCIPRPIGVMMLDIDDFKMYNDRYGHACGDACLQTVGQILSLVGNDTHMISYRYGGEEFVSLVYGGVSDFRNIAERIRTTIKEKDIQGSHITVSVGISPVIDVEHADYVRMVDRADKAMYQAKRNGKDQVCVIGEDLSLAN